MNWKKERDLLIAQTMAFVQSVTGKTPDFEQTSDAAPDVAKPFTMAAQVLDAAPVEAIKIDATEIAAPPVVEPPKEIRDIQASLQIPRAVSAADVRSEMQARVANFRAHQERFNREREQYFSATLSKLRATIDSLPNPTDPTPRNR
jgi:hypothetical protein